MSSDRRPFWRPGLNDRISRIVRPLHCYCYCGDDGGSGSTLPELTLTILPTRCPPIVSIQATPTQRHWRRSVVTQTAQLLYYKGIWCAILPYACRNGGAHGATPADQWTARLDIEGTTIRQLLPSCR